MGVAADDESLVTLARQYIKRRYLKPGNVYLGIVSRLDAGTSGVVLLARTSKAAARLTEQFRRPDRGENVLGNRRRSRASGGRRDGRLVCKNEERQRMEIVEPRHAGAKKPA